MNDLELLDKYCEECVEFISPLLFNDLRKRGIAWIVDYLPSNVQERKAVVRARLAKVGRSFGDDQIDQIANEIKRVQALLSRLMETNMADAHKTIPILKEMLEHSQFILNYYKQ